MVKSIAEGVGQAVGRKEAVGVQARAFDRQRRGQGVRGPGLEARRCDCLDGVGQIKYSRETTEARRYWSFAGSGVEQGDSSEAAPGREEGSWVGRFEC